MLYKVEYQNETDRKALLSLHSDKYLVEDQIVDEGNFLFFTDEKPLSVQIEEVKVKNDELSMTVDSILLDVIPNLFG